MTFKIEDYNKIDVSYRLVNLLESYISLVNEKVWKKK